MKLFGGEKWSGRIIMLTTDDKMFAIEDNRDDEDMSRYYDEHKSGVVGNYKGIDLMDLKIDEIVGMKIGVIEEEGKWGKLEELGYCFEVGV